MDPNFQDAVRLVHSKDPKNKRFGTGFAIHKDEDATYFLTCMHVVVDVGGPDQIIVDRYPAEVVAGGSEDFIDLAVLRVDEPLDIPTLDLSTAGEIGNSFVATGFKEFGKNYLLTPIQGTLGARSIFVSKEQGGLGTWSLEIKSDDTLRRGYSGAPVIDQKTGDVLGVISHREGTQKGLAIPAEALRRIWPEFSPGIIGEKETRKPPKHPRKQPETLSDRISQEGYWSSLQQAAIQAVAAGGMAAMAFYRQTETLATLPWPTDLLERDRKEKNPSTIADLQATAAILQIMDSYLGPVARKLGCSLCYLGEETQFYDWLRKNLRPEVFETIKPPDRFFTSQDNVLRLIFDAIDGTGNFVRGIPLFCSGVAILVDRNVRVSAVYDPIHHIVYSGVLKGPDDNPETQAEAWALQVAMGNRINLVQVANQTEPRQARREALGIHLTRSEPTMLRKFLGIHSSSGESLLERLVNAFGGTYALNSGLLAMADVARGALGGFVNNTTNLWDIAAGEVLIRACKGKVTNFGGSFIDYSSGGRTSVVAARSHFIHSKILNIVRT